MSLIRLHRNRGHNKRACRILSGLISVVRYTGVILCSQRCYFEFILRKDEGWIIRKFLDIRNKSCLDDVDRRILRQWQADPSLAACGAGRARARQCPGNWRAVRPSCSEAGVVKGVRP